MSGNIFVYLLVFMPIISSLISYMIGRKTKQGRNYFVCTVTVFEFLFSFLLTINYIDTEGLIIKIPEICGIGLSFQVDGFRALYGSIAALMWMITTIFSMEYFAHYKNRNRYYLFWLITLGATEAIFFSADLYTTFIFFEIMSFASYVWVAQDERKEALRAASTYLAVAVIGGMVLLMGIFLLYYNVGTLRVDELYDACQGKNVYVAVLCMFVGFGAKAGAFPMHIWLPKAHPVAPAPASALLSGILTKTGIFGVLVISSRILYHDEKWGAFLLIIGVITMFWGAFLAIFSIDFKRTLACSSVSQIGFILVGIGMQGLLAEENALAVRGTVLHMVNHSLFKLVLFMTAGVIYMNVHKLDLNDIRGFGRKKPLLAGIYLMGALGIGGIPLWSGYISKTLLHESIVECIHELEHGAIVLQTFSVDALKVVEWIFLLSGGLTIAYMSKLFVAVFVEKNHDEQLQKKYDANKNYMSKASAAVLTISALIFPVMGIFPYWTMNKLADMSQEFMGLHHAGHEVHYFTWTNLKGSVISIAIGIIVYLFIIRKMMMKTQEDGRRVYVNRWPKIFDLEDFFYRPILIKILPAIAGTCCSVLDHILHPVLLKSIQTVVGTVCGFFDSFVDMIVVLLRRTIFKDYTPVGVLDEGNKVTYTIGKCLNKAEQLLNKTLWKDEPSDTDHIHQSALHYSYIKENIRMIRKSLSYGLLMFTVGLCLTLIYLIIRMMTVS